MKGMQSLIVGIIVISIILVMGIYIVGTIGTTAPLGSLAYNQTINVSNSVVTALGSGTAWITILIVVAFAIIVLGMLTGGLGKHKDHGGPAY